YDHSGSDLSWHGAGSPYNSTGGYSDGFCHQGYQGFSCGECVEDYYQLNEKCQQCENSQASHALFVLLITFVILFMAYSIIQGISWFKCGAASILCDFLQVLGTYLKFDLGWPDVLAIIVYCIAVPAGFGYFLFVNRHGLDSPLFKKAYGAIYIVYQKKLYLWEVLMKLKKLAILATVVFFPENVMVQAVVALTVLAVMFILSANYKPFRYSNNNMLQFYASLVAFIILYMGIFFYSNRLSRREENFISAITIIALVIMLIVLLHGFITEYCSYFMPTIAKHFPAVGNVLLSTPFDALFSTRCGMSKLAHWAYADEMLMDDFMEQRGRTRLLSSDSAASDEPSSPMSPTKLLSKSRSLIITRDQHERMSHGLVMDDLDGMDATRLAKLEQFICYPSNFEEGDSGTFEEWKKMMRRSPLYANLQEALSAIVQFHKLKARMGAKNEQGNFSNWKNMDDSDQIVPKLQLSVHDAPPPASPTAVWGSGPNDLTRRHLQQQQHPQKQRHKLLIPFLKRYNHTAIGNDMILILSARRKEQEKKRKEKPSPCSVFSFRYS
ncbi:hypothetical protein CYMTET_34330, partial [Cymbomonas tetramitiformis]